MKGIKRSHKNSIIFFVLFFLFFTNCADLLNRQSKNEFSKTSKDVLKLIKLANFESLSEYVYNSRGLQFSPYDDVYVGGPDVTTFSKQNVKNFMASRKVYNWGVYDGSGFDIRLLPKEYYKNFIYDIDFEKEADIVFIGNSKSRAPENINLNLAYIFKIYPRSNIVHYYYKGSPNNGFCDFKKLTLVFEEIEKKWFLIGIMHGEKGV